MNELLVTSLDNTDITTWDFPAIKEELQKYLADYESFVYTDETIKDAKDDRTTLNKAKKLVEDARKAYKARCMEPYDVIEPKIKEITNLIEIRRQKIDETIKEYEIRQKEAKGKEVREYFDRVSTNLGSDSDRIYQMIFDPKWANASTSPAKYREEIQIAVGSVLRDIEEIKKLDSPFGDTLKEVYLDTLSMDAVFQKNKELNEAARKAGLSETVGGNKEPTSIAAAASPETAAADEADGTLLRIYASKPRLNQICDFMKAIGVSYEIL